MSMNDLIGVEGAPRQITFNGKTYKLSLINQYVKGVFERKLLDANLARLEHLKGRLPVEEYARREKEYYDAYFAGEYSMLGPDTVKKLETPDGAFLLLGAILGDDCTENELLGLLISKKAEVLPMLKQIIRESFPGIEEPGVGK